MKVYIATVVVSKIEGESCKPVACELYCKYGFKKDASGCDICECLDINYCETVSDCDCGSDTIIGDCALGNRIYIDTQKQCPDFCTGITGTLQMACIDHQCTQVMPPEKEICNGIDDNMNGQVDENLVMPITCGTGPYASTGERKCVNGTWIDSCDVEKTCAEWRLVYLSMIQEMNHCETPSDCASVSGTSCGCTRNVVLNKNEDSQILLDFLSSPEVAGCGLGISTCDCPEADGFTCDDGHCAWNYVD